MADNITVTPGTGASIAADDVGGALYQRVKIGVGADGVATDWTGSIGGGTAMIGHVGGTEYKTIAASLTDQVLGSTGATGDYVAGLLIIPASTSPGAVSIKDGAGSAIGLFAGGASSVSNLVPFFIPLGAKSNAGAWSVTTGASVAIVAFGDFT